MRLIFLTFFLLGAGFLHAYAPKVPSSMEVAGIKIKITEAARREIQKDVDALTRYPKYFNLKLDRVRLYFPVIEEVFRQENVPDDFKYLVIQESGLIPDAVSSSNAVGYWQFKKFTGQEVGLRIDRQVDERMHIVAATRGAAKYMKLNNFYFNNWLYALQAYQMGRGGAEKVVDRKYYGAKKMVINKNTYWYVKKFIAHKIAFEDAYNKAGPSREVLIEYKRGADRSIRDISREVGVSEDKLNPYNLWLKRGKIPSDKAYTVIVPVENMGKDFQEPMVSRGELKKVYASDQSALFPKIREIRSEDYPEDFVKANGIPAVIAKSGDDISSLAMEGTITEVKFRKYNDMASSDQVIPGQVYYFKRKKGKAGTHYHVVREGEDLWTVSQKYGLKLSKLMQKNRIRENGPLEPGRVLWLRFIRPSDEPIEYSKISTNQIAAAREEVEDSVIFKEEPVDSTAVPVVETTAVANDSLTVAEVVEEDAEVTQEKTLHEIMHEVEAGETLYSISRKYEVRVDDIVEWNGIPIDENYKLAIGEKLAVFTQIPPSEVVESETEKKETERVSAPGSVYTVKAGDTWYKISRETGVPVDQLHKINERETDELSVGEEILIPVTKSVEMSDGMRVHIVRPGETLYQIARMYQMTVEELMEANQKEDFNIKIGEKLLVQKAQ